MNPADYFTASWIIIAVAWLSLWLPRRVGYRLAWIGAIAAFSFTAGGFIIRMMLARRAPVTNMYESVVWASWGILTITMVLEFKQRSGAVFLGGFPVAILGLLLTNSYIGLFDPDIHPLPAVLRSNFWLFTHVTTVVAGYAAFGVAMGLGHLMLWKGKFAFRSLFPALEKCLQIGMALLSIGITIGGVWAWQAWGRFWGWDPKETWALVTLLIYAALLHGHLANWWNEYGMAVGVIVGFQGVIMAWYGVNFILKPGLHSYGAGPGGLMAALGFALVEAVFLAVAWIRHLSQKTD